MSGARAEFQGGAAGAAGSAGHFLGWCGCGCR